MEKTSILSTGSQNEHTVTMNIFLLCLWPGVNPENISKEYGFKRLLLRMTIIFSLSKRKISFLFICLSLSFFMRKVGVDKIIV